jgi:hypothetical protein
VSFAKGVRQLVLSKTARETADLTEAVFDEEVISGVQNVPAQNPTLMIQDFLSEFSNFRVHGSPSRYIRLLCVHKVSISAIQSQRGAVTP